MHGYGSSRSSSNRISCKAARSSTRSINSQPALFTWRASWFRLLPMAASCRNNSGSARIGRASSRWRFDGVGRKVGEMDGSAGISRYCRTTSERLRFANAAAASMRSTKLVGSRSEHTFRGSSDRGRAIFREGARVGSRGGRSPPFARRSCMRTPEGCFRTRLGWLRCVSMPKDPTQIQNGLQIKILG